MKCFALNESGDVVMTSADIKTVSGTELIRQKIRQILSTNRGEWFLDSTEGVRRREILKKNPNQQVIKYQIKEAVKKIDASLSVSDFGFKLIDRTLSVSFNVNGDSITLELE